MGSRLQTGHFSPRALARCLSAALLVAWPVAAQTSRAAIDLDVVEATIPELQAAMANGRVTAVGLVDAYLARIAAYDAAGPALNAMIVLNPRARTEAAALDQERRAGRVRGPLHGIPIILKDNFDTADLPTTGGSLALAGFQPKRDAFVVRRLREAGAIVLGKANMHEMAHGITTVSSLGGQTRNPYDLRRCPGGSSGGTGVAIAASFAAVGWGSDTCGSIRIPSAFNGLYGLRPSQGLVSRDGIIPLSHTQDIAGPLARSVTDLAIALDATVAIDSTDPAARLMEGRPLPRFVEALTADALRGARLAVLLNYFSDTDGEIADTVRSAIRAMKALGADVIEIRLAELDTLIARTGVIPYEMKFDLNDYLARHGHAPVASLSEILSRGLFHEALEERFRARDTVSTRDSEPYLKNLARQDQLRARLVALFDSLQLTAFVYPTMRQRPAFIGDPQSGGTCQLSAHSGLPALSMPAGFTQDGLPVGLELMGRPFDDARLVAMAFAFERAGSRRRAPHSAPPLVSGRPPAPREFAATVRASSAVARMAFSFDPLRNEIGYDVRVTGIAPERIHAVVLRRVDSAGPVRERVIERLSGPGAARASGRVTLNGADRRALMDGRLTVWLFTADGSGGVTLKTGD